MHESSVDNKSSLYADDSSFYTVGYTVAEIETNLNQDLKKVTDWCTRNRMFIHKTKTKSMLLCTRQKRMNLESTLKIKFDNNYLEYSVKRFLVLQLMNIYDGLNKLMKPTKRSFLTGIV